MQSRRAMLESCAKKLAATVTTMATLAIGNATAGVPRGPLLEERLLVGLRVKTESDKKFIQRVVDLVERKILPLKLVDSTFFWAREKASQSRRLANNPMVYFRPALVARAARIGIRV